MKNSVRWSTAFLLAIAAFPAMSFARPIRAISHTNTGVIRQRTPTVQSHESILHHSK